MVSLTILHVQIFIPLYFRGFLYISLVTSTDLLLLAAFVCNHHKYFWQDHMTDNCAVASIKTISHDMLYNNMREIRHLIVFCNCPPDVIIFLLFPYWLAGTAVASFVVLVMPLSCASARASLVSFCLLRPKYLWVDDSLWSFLGRQDNSSFLVS